MSAFLQVAAVVVVDTLNQQFQLKQIDRDTQTISTLLKIDGLQQKAATAATTKKTRTTRSMPMNGVTFLSLLRFSFYIVIEINCINKKRIYIRAHNQRDTFHSLHIYINLMNEMFERENQFVVFTHRKKNSTAIRALVGGGNNAATTQKRTQPLL